MSSSSLYRTHTHLLPTLFDRLQDDAPSQRHEAPGSYTVNQKRMMDIIRRDLGYLLNTTNMQDCIDSKRYPAAADSTLNYGITPLAGCYVANRRWHDIEKMLRTAITRFEPRLIPDSLKITPAGKQGSDCPYNVLAFAIRGLVHMDPYPLEFMLQSILDLENSRLTIVPSSSPLKEKETS